MVIESAGFYTRLKLPLHLQEIAIAGLFNETMCCQNLVLVASLMCTYWYHGSGMYRKRG